MADLHIRRMIKQFIRIRGKWPLALSAEKNSQKIILSNQTIKVMKNQISKSDFRFELSGFGRYIVTYTSPATGKEFKTAISHMPLIDATKNADNPKIKDLNHLKTLCKS